MINNRRSFITGVKGLKLKKNEILFLKKYKPWGIILFSRNIISINQTKILINSIKRIFNDNKYPILIDEEGGNVSRLKSFIDTSEFTAEYFGHLYNNNKKKFYLYLDVYINQISHLLETLGININTVPVLDVKRNYSNKIIKKRCFSSDKNIVSKIGKICISKFHKKGISTVIKHIPGHGLSTVDSHLDLPIVKKNYKYLLKTDFYPFKNQKSLFAMTAHIKYSKIDSINPATHSKKVINLIRKKIKFKGILISDDISMKALKDSVKNNTIKSFSSGCNLVLHCNGNLKEMYEVAKNSPKLDNFLIKKTSQFMHIIS